MKTALSHELIKELPSYLNEDSEELQNDGEAPLQPKASFELISDSPSNAKRFYQRKYM